MKTALTLATLLLATVALAADRDEDPLAKSSDLEKAMASLDALGLGSDPHSRRLSAFVEETRSIIGELKPFLTRRERVKEQFVRTQRVAEIEAEREEVNRGIEEHSQRLWQLADEFKELKMQANMQKVMLVLASMQSKRAPEDADREIGVAMQMEAFHRGLLDFKKSVAKSTTLEREAYQETLKAVQFRRTMLIIGALLGATVLVGLSLAFFYGRKAVSQTVPIMTHTTTPAGAAPRSGLAAGAASGPAQAYASGPAAAMLSGPVAGAGELIGGNFRVEREIGRGGMGLVFAALDLTLQRRVAIKRMKPEVVENPKELEMFLAEARLVASLKHPNLVEIHSIVREGGQLYLVFEFVAGKPLHALLDEGRLPYARVKDILRQVAAGLDYAHSQKVIHRDLKPSNVMLTEEGVVKLMDFGIAHQAKKTVARLTRAEAWGTPPYMSPEQELGTVSRESDLYSLGVCCYEMAVGRLPFEGPNYLAQKRERVYAPPSSAGLPRELDALIARALDPDPRGRFHSGAELAAAAAAVPDRSPA